MKEYFAAAINQLVERGEQLLLRIPAGLPREFHLLEQTCRERLEHVLDELQDLNTAPDWLKTDAQPERLRQFKRLVADLDLLETVCIAALERARSSDLYLNRLVERIRQEIAYPLLPPVVMPFSQSYFQTWLDFNLMLVPLSEGDFLLHLPDLYHELAHLLLHQRRNRRVQPFADAFMQAIDGVTRYIDRELQKERARGGPSALSDYLDTWLFCWLKGWGEEFFCDLFAIYTLGPAFAWSHLHLAATRGDDPYKVPLNRSTTHPPDGARMAVILEALTLAGFTGEAKTIEERWTHFVTATETTIEPEYHRCFPRQLIKLLADKALQGVTEVGCNLAQPQAPSGLGEVFTQAWQEFWRDPRGYVEWEKKAVAQLRQKC